jgi:hypothetical protein
MRILAHLDSSGLIGPAIVFKLTGMNAIGRYEQAEPPGRAPGPLLGSIAKSKFNSSSSLLLMLLLPQRTLPAATAPTMLAHEVSSMQRRCTYI